MKKKYLGKIIYHQKYWQKIIADLILKDERKNFFYNLRSKKENFCWRNIKGRKLI